jgi:diguanylate cyclase (GGDEF)-like protein
MKLLSGILVLFAGLLLAQPAVARDLIVSRTMLDDATGTLTIADVAGHIVTPVDPSFGIANSKTVHWLCLHVQPPAQGSKVVLYLFPSFLNDVRLYVAGPGNPQTWKTRATGNQFPYGDRDRASTTLGFVVDVGASGATFYLRLRTRSPAQFSVQALEPAEAASNDYRHDLIVVFFLTAMLCLLLWAILSYLLDRQPVVGLFAVHQAVYTFFGFVVTGYLAPWVPDRFPQLADSVDIVLYCAINFTPVLFCRALFQPYDPPPRLMRGFNLLLWTFPVLLAAIALGFDSPAVNINSALIKLTWFFFVVVAFSLRKESTPSRRLLQIFFVSILMTNVAFWVSGLSSRIASLTDLTAFRVLIINGLVIGGLFAMILHTRARQARREAEQAAMNLILVQKKFELEQELKRQAQVQAQTDYLTGLFNRRRFVELAERELARSIRFQRPFTLLMIDIDHFKTVNDTWGHSVGDVVLQQVAQLIRDTLREEDIFGRMGGEEFAAAIVETDGAGAMEVAERLCATVADAVIVPQGGERIQVSISIGLSQLNGRNIAFDSLLNEADSAMYDAKESGRNRVLLCEQN